MLAESERDTLRSDATTDRTQAPRLPEPSGRRHIGTPTHVASSRSAGSRIVARDGRSCGGERRQHLVVRAPPPRRRRVPPERRWERMATARAARAGRSGRTIRTIPRSPAATGTRERPPPDRVSERRADPVPGPPAPRSQGRVSAHRRHPWRRRPRPRADPPPTRPRRRPSSCRTSKRLVAVVSAPAPDAGTRPAVTDPPAPQAFAAPELTPTPAAPPAPTPAPGIDVGALAGLPVARIDRRGCVERARRSGGRTRPVVDGNRSLRRDDRRADVRRPAVPLDPPPGGPE